MTRARRGSLGTFLLSAILVCTLTGSSWADPLAEVRAVARVGPIDPAKLEKGQILCTRQPLGEFPRGISLESCYFIHASIQEVGDALLHWDPLQHKDLEVRFYGEYLFPTGNDVFRRLKLDANVADDNWLLQQLNRAMQTGDRGDLHLTNEEITTVAQKKLAPNDAWQVILRQRSEAFAQGGMAGAPPFEKSISPASEYRGLLSLVPTAARHFQSVTRAAPFVAKGKAPSESVPYWEAGKVYQHTTLQLGIFTARKGTDSWQLANCIYYPSDTYFMALDLFHLWSVDGGTLVWQVGLASAPFRSYLGGIDRYFAGRLMSEQTIDTIKAFRLDLERKR